MEKNNNWFVAQEAMIAVFFFLLWLAVIWSLFVFFWESAYNWVAEIRENFISYIPREIRFLIYTIWAGLLLVVVNYFRD